MHKPERHQDQLHTELLHQIASVLWHRTQHEVKTSILKVKSHVGIEGNELADAAAKAASRIPNATDVQESSFSRISNFSRTSEKRTTHDPEIGLNPATHRQGPQTYTIETIPERFNNDTMTYNRMIVDYRWAWDGLPPLWLRVKQDTEPGCTPRTITVRNPRKGYQEVMTQKLNRASLKETNYGNGLREEMKTVCPKRAAKVWTLGTDAQLSTVAKIRTGMLTNFKLLRIWGKTTKDTCPLCGMKDSCAHIVTAECTHPLMKSLAIHRHNLAVHALADGYMKTNLAPDSTLITDLGDQHDRHTDYTPLEGQRRRKRLPDKLHDALMDALVNRLKNNCATTKTLLQATLSQRTRANKQDL